VSDVTGLKIGGKREGGREGGRRIPINDLKVEVH